MEEHTHLSMPSMMLWTQRHAMAQNGTFEKLAAGRSAQENLVSVTLAAFFGLAGMLIWFVRKKVHAGRIASAGTGPEPAAAKLSSTTRRFGVVVDAV
jgi:hypothetical protein